MSHRTADIVTEVGDVPEGTLDVGGVEAGDCLMLTGSSKYRTSPLLERYAVARWVGFGRLALIALIRFEISERGPAERQNAMRPKGIEVFVEGDQALLDFRPVPVEEFDFIAWRVMLSYVSDETGLREDAVLRENRAKQLAA